MLGRIAPEKGVDQAIKIAIRCGIPLKIAAKVDRGDQEYYDEIIRPLLRHSLVEYIGEIGDHEKSDFLSGATALVADRLAGALRSCDDRGHGVRHARDRVQPRFCR